jgi:hypothetical protein
MSGAASNYDLPRMYIGITVQAVSFAMACIYTITSGIRKLDFGSIFTITVTYGIMMVASSYVEEEQHFWYWLGAGWVYYISAIRYATHLSMLYKLIPIVTKDSMQKGINLRLHSTFPHGLLPYVIDSSSAGTKLAKNMPAHPTSSQAF